ncbi:MAG: ATPase, T2SS/T4P/T4SS family [Fusobacteria bacterium]|nr:ATPase, T2SS/T4P/T4SS family [Fusobacteriota bacterium]
MARKKLGEKLVKNGIITQEQLVKAVEYQYKTGRKLATCIVELEFATSSQILPLLAEEVGFKPVNPHAYFESIKELVQLMPKDLLENCDILPIEKDGNKLILGMTDPFDLEMIDRVQMVTGFAVSPVLLMKNDIEEMLEKSSVIKKQSTSIKEEEEQNTLEKAEREFASATDILGDLSTFEDYEMEKLVERDEGTEEADQGPIIEAVDKIISHAIALKASDIHIEPFDDEVRVRFRVDGILHLIKTFPKVVARVLSARIKIMSDLNIAERRLPQDGRIKLKIKITPTQVKEIDFRVSILPTIYGEKVVMRILDSSAAEVSLEDLGMSQEDKRKLESASDRPYGMILITGPTGSGKSTTLYSVLQRVNKGDVNISTAEDPVEYRLKGANQVMCKESIGLTFASVLRSFLRQDPDIIMVGEVRDEETAGIAVKAALTGHLVLSTIHTNDAPSTIQRLLDMGIEPYLLASSLVLIQAQRLGRKLCKFCKEEESPSQLALSFEALKLSAEKYKDVKFYKGKGCPRCSGTGYKGRIGFYEVMEMNDAIRASVKPGVNSEIIRELAKANGMQTLREDGVRKAVAGITSLEEVLRVTIENGS